MASMGHCWRPGIMFGCASDKTEDVMQLTHMATELQEAIRRDRLDVEEPNFHSALL